MVNGLLQLHTRGGWECIAYPYMVKMIVLSLGTLFKATEWGQ